MRYCPYCHRINTGHPLICRFCGRTWYIRLCSRLHENPYNAVRCGQCGDTNLSQTVGRRPWLIIAFKSLLWFILILFVYDIITGFLNFLKGQHSDVFFSWLIILVLLLIGFNFIFRLLPGSIGRAVGKIGRLILRLLSLIGLRSLKALWALLK